MQLKRCTCQSLINVINYLNQSSVQSLGGSESRLSVCLLGITHIVFIVFSSLWYFGIGKLITKQLNIHVIAFKVRRAWKPIPIS